MLQRKRLLLHFWKNKPPRRSNGMMLRKDWLTVQMMPHSKRKEIHSSNNMMNTLLTQLIHNKRRLIKQKKP